MFSARTFSRVDEHDATDCCRAKDGTEAGEESQVSSLSGIVSSFSVSDNEMKDCIGSIGSVVNPTTFFGRDREKALLFAAYHRTRIPRAPSEVVLIRGRSGVGKSSLALQLRNPVSSSDGYFVHGKWEQCGSKVPFSGLVDALSDLCDLVIQAPDFEKRRSKIRQILGPGSDGRVLFSLFPRVELFGEDAAEEEDRRQDTDDATTARMQAGFKAFVQALTGSVKHPVVIVLDDLQWCTEGTVEILRALLADEESRNVLFLFTCREEEERSKDAFELIEDVKRKRTKAISGTTRRPVSEVLLGDFCLDTLESMIASQFGLSVECVEDLAKALHDKTDGNALHTAQFLTHIRKAGMLRLEGHTWVCDIQRIRGENDVSENVFQLIENKIDLMNADVRSILAAAAFIGYKFRRNQLAHITSAEQSTVDNALKLGASEGLIECLDRESLLFKFRHDSIQQGLYQSVKEEKGRARLHLAVAEQLHLDCIESDVANVCTIADHLNRAGPVIATEHDLKWLVLANEQAAQLALAQADFFVALHYANEGMKHIGDTITWNRDYRLCLQLSSVACKSKYCTGDFAGSQELAKEIVTHGRSSRDKMRAYTTMIRAEASGSSFPSATNLGIEILASLDFKIPATPNTFQTRSCFARTKRKLHKLSNDELLGLRVMSDEKFSLISSILGLVSIFAFAIGNRPLFAYCSLQNIQLCLEKGLSDSFPTALVTFAEMEQVSGNMENAYRYANMGANLQSRTKSDRFFCYTIGFANILVLHWQQPLFLSPQQLHDAYRSALLVGNIGTAFMLASTCLQLVFLGDTNLEKVEEDARNAHRRAIEFSHHQSLLYIQPVMQAVQNLLGKSDDPLVLTGDVMDEADYLNRVSERPGPGFGTMLCRLKLDLACIFQDVNLAEEMMNRVGDEMIKPTYLFFGTYSFRLSAALTCIQLYRTKRKRRYLARAKKFSRGFGQMVRKGCPNVPPLHLLIKAELMACVSSSPKPKKVMSLFNQAIRAAERARFSLVKALATERAAMYMDSTGQSVEAVELWARTNFLYRNWGAIAKVRSLDRRVGKLREVEDLSTDDILGSYCVTMRQGSSKTSENSLGQSSSFLRFSDPVSCVALS